MVVEKCFFIKIENFLKISFSSGVYGFGSDTTEDRLILGPIGWILISLHMKYIFFNQRETMIWPPCLHGYFQKDSDLRFSVVFLLLWIAAWCAPNSSGRGGHRGKREIGQGVLEVGQVLMSDLRRVIGDR